MEKVTAVRLYELKLPFDHTKEHLQIQVAKRLSTNPEDILETKIIKKSLDARLRGKPYFVYCVDVTLVREMSLTENRRMAIGIKPSEEENIHYGIQPLKNRPVIIGCGPSGLFAAWELASHGYAPIVIDQGEPIERRMKTISRFLATRDMNPCSNYVFGEGGAGAYSDGKLYTGVTSPHINQILQTLVHNGAPSEILYVSPPHIGSDRLRGTIINMRKSLQNMGGEFYFDEKVNEILIQNNKITGVITEKRKILADVLILGTGSHAEETFLMLMRQQIAMSKKPFQIGLRIEHPQELIDKRLLGIYAGHPALSPASYKLVSRKKAKSRQVCSFCMCPGGEIMPGTGTPECLVTNGMSDHKRDTGFANSALVTTIEPEDLPDSPLAGISYRKAIEKRCFEAGGKNYSAPAQRASDFLYQKKTKEIITSSYRLGTCSCRLDTLLPTPIIQAIARVLPEFEEKIVDFISAGVLVAPETRASCPVCILRNQDTMQSVSCENLYPVGEGAGYAGGIISAAIDGIKASRKIMARFAKL